MATPSRDTNGAAPGERVAELREQLGEALDKPDGRFELELALRAQGLQE